MSAAQSDFDSLQQLGPETSPSSSTASSSSSPSANPVAQTVNQLAQDLQAGNLSAAQQEYSTLQQDFQSQAAQAGGHRHHRHHHAGATDQNNPLTQAFGQLAQALQSGNTAAAQTAYTTLQTNLQQFAQANGLTPSQSLSSSSGSGSSSQSTSTTLSVSV